jgi:hypothetical protein
VNVNINNRFAVEHSHLLLLLASRLILVATCLPSLNQSLELLLSFVKSPHGGRSSMGLCMPMHGPAKRSKGHTNP